MKWKDIILDSVGLLWRTRPGTPHSGPNRWKSGSRVPGRAPSAFCDGPELRHRRTSPRPACWFCHRKCRGRFCHRMKKQNCHVTNKQTTQLIYKIWGSFFFSLYIFPFAHFKDNDDECSGILTGKSWIFNMSSWIVFFNSLNAFILLKQFCFFLLLLCSFFCASFFWLFFVVSQSHFYMLLCSFFCHSFFLFLFCSFSITLSTLMLLWTSKLWKHWQLLATNENNFWSKKILFLNVMFIASIFLSTCHLLIST